MMTPRIDKLVESVLSKLDRVLPLKQVRVRPQTADMLDSWVACFKLPMEPFKAGATWQYLGRFFTADKTGWIEVFPQRRYCTQAKLSVVLGNERIWVWPISPEYLQTYNNYSPPMEQLRKSLASDWKLRKEYYLSRPKPSVAEEGQSMDAEEVSIDLSPVSTPTPPTRGVPLSPAPVAAAVSKTPKRAKVSKPAIVSDDEDYNIEVSI